ncbi:MAG TPA: hypothetical protein VNH80_03865 [Burkholderiales bacterium]|nr:hypothetical protein [Burkholderiales bacterium]
MRVLSRRGRELRRPDAERAGEFADGRWPRLALARIGLELDDRDARDSGDGSEFVLGERLTVPLEPKTLTE